MTRHVALLRGINVGGRRKLAMKALVEIFTDAGCGDVRTYIQSGNVVYSAPPPLARRVPSLVGKAIASRFGFDVPVVTRTAAELTSVAKNNPFLKRRAGEKALHVGFLLDRPPRPRVAALDPDRSPGDEFAVRGGEIYLYLPNGVARTKLTSQYLDSTLGTVVTVRNWRTVHKLLDLSR